MGWARATHRKFHVQLLVDYYCSCEFSSPLQIFNSWSVKTPSHRDIRRQPLPPLSFPLKRSLATTRGSNPFPHFLPLFHQKFFELKGFGWIKSFRIESTFNQKVLSRKFLTKSIYSSEKFESNFYVLERKEAGGKGRGGAPSGSTWMCPHPQNRHSKIIEFFPAAMLALAWFLFWA